MGLLENTKRKILMGKRFIVKITKERCKGCGLCIGVCPQNALKLSGSYNKNGYHFVEFFKDDCKGCKKCAIICPDAAIEIFFKEDTLEKKEE